MEVFPAVLSLLMVGFLVSSGAAGLITYAMVQAVNRKRGKEEKPRKWNRDIFGIVSDYRAECPKGKLTGPLVVAVLLTSGCGVALFIAFTHLGTNMQ